MKIKNVVNFRDISLQLVLIISLGLVGCAKDLDEKLPDDFERDVHAIKTFNEPVVIETIDKNVETLAVKSDVASGIYALNERGYRGVKMVKGPATLKPLFEGFTIESEKAGERYNIEFKLTKSHLIAYAAVEDKQHLSSATLATATDFNNKTQVPLFHFPINDYGIVRNSLNDLDEQTRFIEFKSTKKAEASHIKLTATPNNRVLNGLRGFHNEKVISKKLLEQKVWSLNDVAKFFNVAKGNINLSTANATKKDLTSLVLDDHIYILNKTTVADLTTIEKIALRRGDPRISKCNKEAFSEADLDDTELCILKPVFYGKASKAKLKLRLDDEGEQLGVVELDYVSGSQPADFVIITTNTQFNRFTYDERITGVDNQYIYDFNKIHEANWDPKELAKVLKTDRDLGTQIVKTIVADKMIWILAPVERSSLQAADRAAIGNDPRFRVCDQDILAKVNLKDCVLKPAQFIISVPSNIRLTFYEDQDLPRVVMEPVLTEDKADFLMVISSLNALDFTYARTYRDRLYDKSLLQAQTWEGKELAQTLNKPALRKFPTLVTKILNESLWILVPSKKSSFDIFEAAMIDNDPRYETCSHGIALHAKIDTQDCFLKPLYSAAISHTLFEFEEQDNEIIPALRVRTNVDRRLSSHVYIDPNGELLDFNPSNRITQSESFRNKDDYQNVVRSGEELAKILNIPELKNNKKAKTKIIDNVLWVLVPTKLENLHLIERSAVENDPRYEKCTEEIAEASKLSIEDCILRPEFNRVGSFVGMAFERRDNDDIPSMRIDYDVKPSQSSIIYFTDKNEATRFNYMRNIQIADRVITNKVADIDLDARYVYVPMTHGTPREVIAADPFYQGNEKIVRLKWSEEGLEVYEEDRDPRFRNNLLNALPVLTIPGAHEDYKCLEDNNGNCTTGVEFDRDKTWDKKRFFVPDLERLKLKELNSLDVFTVESDPCLINTGVELIHHEIKPGVINIELEKTYKTSNSFRCIIELYYADTEALTGLSNAGFKVRFFYSIVKLDDLKSKDYEAVAYPIPDHGEFGFFKDYKQRLNQNFDPERTNQDYFLNRWNPKKKEIVYHLSDTFNEKGQEKIKQATYRSFETMNKSLEKANAGIRLTLKEPSGKKAGDLRNNMIVLITDPLSNGLLGYAPTVTNPETGEIIQGHVNMYSGVIRAMSRRVWENMVDFSVDQVQQQAKNKKLTKRFATAPDMMQIPAQRKVDFNKVIPKNQVNLKMEDMVNQFKRNKNQFDGKKLEQLAQKAYQLNGERLKLKKSNINNSQQEETMDPVQKRLQFVQDRLNRWSENNAYAEEFFQIAHTVKALLPGVKDIKGVLNSDGTLKRWDLLTSEQKEAAMDIINPYTYTSTLVHEVGHNLGLRHNFTGSFDKANFYSDAEARSLGLKSTPAYSSIMDYAASELDELTVFGKYDVAALRFAYAREIEDEQGKFHKIPTSLAEFKKENSDIALRNYMFCTDENAELSATCNRFDEGSSYTEIANILVKRYEDNYKYRNFRDGRDTFQAEGIDGYVFGRYMEFNRMRDLFEDFEFFGTIFGHELMEQGCGPQDLANYPICKDINDRRDAVQIVGNLLLKVLKTPDHVCALINPAEPTVIQELRPLSKIYEDIKYSIPYVTKTCFDDAVKERVQQDGLEVVAEAGKFLNGFKDNDPNYIYSNDRAVRGVWPDKAIAMKTIFQRESGKPLTETEHRSLMDHQYIAARVGNFFDHILLGEPLQEAVPFKLADGTEVQIPYTIDLSYEIDGPQRYNYWVKDFFNLPSSGNELLVRTLLKTAHKWGTTRDLKYRDASRNIVNTFSLRKADIEDGMLGDELTKVNINEIIYGASEANIYAKHMLDSLVHENFLTQVPVEVIVAVAQYRLDPPMPADLTEEQIIAVKLDESLLQQLITVAEQGAEFTEQQLIGILGPQLGRQAFIAYNVNFGLETRVQNLQRVLEIKNSLDDAPDEANDVERRLFEIPLPTIIQFARGELAGKVKNYVEILPHMPVHIRAVNW